MGAALTDLQAPVGTISALLEWRARCQPGLPAFAFMDSRLAVTDTDSYASLAHATACVASALARAGVGAGDPVVLACPPGLDFVRAFYGILRAGAAATPTQPPTEKNAAARLRHICANSGARWGIASRTALAAMARSWTPECLRWLAIEDCIDAGPGPLPPLPGPEAAAICQYSSGTVGTPHGVRITHGNLMHNNELIRRAFVHTSKQRGLVWLPPYHDMGLVGGIVQPLYAGFRTTLMAPRTFLRSPVNWLKAITLTGAGTSGGPDFAYQSCLAASDDELERANLDLSRWNVAFNGAETVNPETLKLFSRRFRRFGFRRSAFTCCYGLAEATLFVAASKHMQVPGTLAVDRAALAAGEVRIAPKAGTAERLLVGHGAPLQTVRIVTPDGGEASPREVGEIWITGPSVASAIGADVDASPDYFPDDPRPWVRSGDLGFVHQGELYVTGRSKAIVVVRGRNHQAEDIEASCRALDPALAQMGAAAFGDDQSGVVIVLEVAQQYPGMDALLERVRTTVAEAHGLAVDELLLVRERSLARTPSGKIRRNVVATAYRGGGLAALASWRAPAAGPTRVTSRPPLPRMPSLVAVPRVAAVELMREWLAALLAAELNMGKADIDPDTHFGVYGLDSLAALNLALHIGDQCGAELEGNLFWDYPNCAMLAEHLLGPQAAPAQSVALETGVEA